LIGQVWIVRTLIVRALIGPGSSVPTGASCHLVSIARRRVPGLGIAAVPISAIASSLV
jgi:hypothetical protein